jgi:pimeloyl-ACP methyl ester carboxylesterase
MRPVPIVVLLTTALLATLTHAADLTAPATSPAPTSDFTGPHSEWHGFSRYDFSMDENTMEVTPLAPNEKPAGRRCIIVTPLSPAPGNPWSWRGVYWDHEPQTEIELLKRGFHVAYITADANLKPDKKWDAWYSFLTTQHHLAQKPAFVGMSRGGEYSYIWATRNPDQVACIYGDNPGGNSEILSHLEPLAKNDVPLLHVDGSIDPILNKYSNTIESIYHQFGGRISVMIKEGAGHHPHSLRDPTPIADFIEQSVREKLAPTAAPPLFAGLNSTRSSYYSLDPIYKEFPSENNYLTLRGPLFTPCYTRWDVWMGFDVPVIIIASRTPAKGNPWVFRADAVARDAVVDQALLAKGYSIVTGPTGYNADGPVLANWNKVYANLTADNFSRKPIMAGAGGAAGEALAWATENPDKVSALYFENPTFISHMLKTSPLDNLAPLVKAGVPIFISAGDKDPALEPQTRAFEKRYQDAGGKITVLINQGVGHYPTAPKDPKPAVDFILNAEKANP